MKTLEERTAYSSAKDSVDHPVVDPIQPKNPTTVKLEPIKVDVSIGDMLNSNDDDDKHIYCKNDDI